jgi:hypothetical protein
MKLTIFILTVSLVLCSCTKDFETINTDPTKSSTIDPKSQLNSAAYFLSGNREMGYPNLYIMQPLVQYINGSWGMRSGTKYIRNDFYNNRVWEIYYSKGIKELVDLQERCKSDSLLVNYVAAARILKVYIFSILTDLYGDIPYSQAAKAYYSTIYTPAYDTQESIYNDFFTELDAAVLQFNTSRTALSNDIVFDGNISKWKKLANSLHLRLAMRLTEVNSTKAKEEAQAAIASGALMESNDDDFKMLHESFAYPDLRGNGYSQALQEESTFSYAMGCSTFVNYLKQESDPRIASFFVSTDEDGKDISAKTNYFSIAPGLYWWDNWSDFTAADGTVIPHARKFCYINAPFYQLNAPFLHMGYSEVSFLEAEAASRGWISGDANTYYQQGIRAAIEQLSLYPGMTALSTSAINTFISAHTLTSGKEIEQINMQKWVDLFPNGFEAFSNQRRSGYPVLAAIEDVGPETETNGVAPKRLFYPSTEALENTVNYQAALSRMNGKNDWLVPVWWDK